MSKRAELASKPTGPLSGRRILELTSGVNGPYATQILADQGADVIKIEDPGGDRGMGGDTLRWAGRVPEHAPRDLGPIFISANRNKRSLVVDLRTEPGNRALRRLIARSDVFLTSVRHSALERLGLSYVQVREINPAIIYVHAVGFGSSGPYAGEPAWDEVIQSASGFCDLLPRNDGDPRPRFLPTLVADKVSSLFIAQAATAALLHREATGVGQFVEVPMLECVTSFLLVEHLNDRTFEPSVGEWGYPGALTPHRKPFRTKDGYIGLKPHSAKQWDQLFEIAGLGEVMAADPRFADAVSREKHRYDVYPLVEEIVATKTTQEWLDLLKPLSIPVARLNRLDDLLDEPHLEAVGFFETYHHPQAGDYRQTRPPVAFSMTPSNVRRHPPRLGEHTQEILAELEDGDRG